MDPPVRLDWDGLPIPPDPKEIYAIHDWSAVEEAVRFYAPNNVELAVHPDASLRFANEFVKELKSGQGAEEGYLVINPEIAYCKAEMFHSLLPHVKALGDWAISIGSEIKKVGAVVREMTSRYNDACERNIFPLPGPDAQVHEPLAETERVYMQVTSKRGLDLVAAPFRKHMATLPQRCTSLAEMASAQPSEEAVQTELYKMNLQFLQEKLKLLGSFEEQVKKIHANMDELLLGSMSLGSAKTVVDFVDVNLMSGKLFKTKTDDGEINTGDGDSVTLDKSRKRSASKTGASKSVTLDKSRKRSASKIGDGIKSVTSKDKSYKRPRAGMPE